MNDDAHTRFRRVPPSAGAAGGGIPGSVYGLALVGTAVYNLQHAGSFGAGVLGFLKALVWPAQLVYELLSYLHR